MSISAKIKNGMLKDTIQISNNNLVALNGQTQGPFSGLGDFLYDYLAGKLSKRDLQEINTELSKIQLFLARQAIELKLNPDFDNTYYFERVKSVHTGTRGKYARKDRPSFRR